MSPIVQCSDRDVAVPALDTGSRVAGQPWARRTVARSSTACSSQALRTSPRFPALSGSRSASECAIARPRSVFSVRRTSKRGAKKVAGRSRSERVLCPRASSQRRLRTDAVGVKKLSRAAGFVPERIQANPSGRVSNVSLANVGTEGHRLRRAVTARLASGCVRRSTLLFLGGRGIVPVVITDATVVEPMMAAPRTQQGSTIAILRSLA